MITDVAVLASATVDLVVASSSDGDGTSLGLLFLLAGPAFYALVYFRYRNTNKRHHHESETRAQMLDVRADDRFHRSLRGVSHRRMKGANNTEVRGARNGGISFGSVRSFIGR